jgi:hypothetical protein
MVKPLVLIDVDGPLNPYYGPSEKSLGGYVSHRMKPKGWEYGKGLKVSLNPLHGLFLRDLGADLVWATMWNADANVWIGPHLGLPELPFIRFGDSETVIIARNDQESRNLHYKTGRIAFKMNKHHYGRPFLWIDDEVTKADETFLRDVCGVNVKCYYVNPKIGLNMDDFEKIEEWITNSE